MKRAIQGLDFLLLSMGVITLFHSCKNKNDGIFPERKDITQTVYASGYISPVDEYQVYAQSEGVVLEILHQEGDHVKEGDVLLKIKSIVQDARLQSAQTALQLAGLNASEDSPLIQEATASYISLGNKLRLDSLNHIRFQTLLSKNSTTRLEADRAELAYKNSKNELDAAASKLRRLKLQVKTELEQAKANSASTQDEQGNTLIKSHVTGLVYTMTKEPGEVVRRGEVVAKVGSDRSIILKLLADESDYSLINPGQKVLFSADVYGDRVMQAKIIRKYPYISRTEQSFQVDAVPLDTALLPLSGAAVEANIITASQTNVLVIPASFLLPGDSVLMEGGGKKKKVKVKVGIRDLDHVQILSGIDGSTKVFKE